ncbi:two-component regulator propeller domain-containing protein [Aliikangiella sp. G2MR2-5]|uniref:ligand-binding sensor domain-containing protein n=1 Tax=Aliikangiella sp. G2MR2-5 TaxID=2788943 RepID=UPI0018AB7776|nr:two-component regulator propeller domain-containing protein [Aliikangiella sp. G2MR2-5]
MKIKITLKNFFLSLCLFPTALVALDFENTNFQHISTEHGLSQKSVETIWQDSTGFLWIGTQEGLNRYDGTQIKTYRHDANDKSSLSHDLIRDIKEDASKNLWIATSGGLNRFIRANEKFEMFSLNTPEGKTITRINKIYVELNGRIWIGTEGGGLFYSEGVDRKVTFKQYEQIPELKNASVKAVYRDSRERLWVGTDRNGVYLIDRDLIRQFVSDDKVDDAISHNQIRSITEDSKGKIWIGTRGGGLNVFNEISKGFTSFKNKASDPNSLSHNRVYQVFEDSSQRLWIGTDGGINIYNREEKNFWRINHRSSQRSGLSHNRVLSIFEDQGGILWFGTLSGLNQWNPHTAAFQHYRKIIERANSLNNNTVYAFEEDPAGNILIGTFGGGLNILQPSSGQVTPLEQRTENLLSSRRIMSLLVDREKNIWVGSISNGIEVLDSRFRKMAHYKHNDTDNSSISGDAITSLMQDREGMIWVTTFGFGLNQFDPKSKRFKYFKRSQNNSPHINEKLFFVMEDSDGYLWVASDGSGISRFDKSSNEFTHFLHDDTRRNSLSGNNVLTIFEDSKGRFWIGTLGNGLNRWEPENRRRGVDEFKHYGVQNGLNSSTVYGVVEDDSGALWISTTRGLNRLDTETDRIEHFNLAEEIHHNELNQGAALRASNGMLYFGGTNGVSAFFPQSIKKNPHAPSIALTRVSSENKVLYFDKPLNDLTEVTFTHKDYLISFEFAALDFAQPEKNQYKYKLEGLYDDWIDTQNFNRATFTNLPSGSYVLKVKGSNNDGVWSEESINLRVNVLPAPWFSWWAFSLYALGFCVVLLLIIRTQAKRLANQEVFQDMVTEKVANKTALHEKNNRFLLSQIEQMKHKVSFDSESGLPNQLMMSALVSHSLTTLDLMAQGERLLSWSLQISIIELESSYAETEEQSRELSRIFSQFQSKFIGNDNNLEVFRWGKNALGIVALVEKKSRLMTMETFCLNQLQKLLGSDEAFRSGCQMTIVSVKAPFEGVQHEKLNGESLLMLIEHLLQLIKLSGKEISLRVCGVNQNINQAKMRQIMDASSLEEVRELFIFECDD